ncbi:MAG: DUF4445 domain-containing protein, partial [Deltaproteobacteria bacterium]
MSDRISVQLHPLGHTIEVAPGTPLRDVLLSHGVEFPCGGRGHCRRCRVRLQSGSLPPTPRERSLLSHKEIANGWRLACCATVSTPITLEIEQFCMPILADESHFAFEPRPGLGIAIDVGTTTIVAQLLDLQTGSVLASASALNPQAAYGSDLMSRVRHALEAGGRRRLAHLVRSATGRLIARLLAEAGSAPERVESIVAVGNTVMHHLFCGLDVSNLAVAPFKSDRLGLARVPAAQLGWPTASGPDLEFLPCLGGFVGSDVLAGILATAMHERDEPVALIDLGTNGEIVVGNAERMLCASAAAGPAFE